MNNLKIRKKILENMMKLYELDWILGISEATRCRMMRRELPEKEQNRICNLIDEYLQGKSER